MTTIKDAVEFIRANNALKDASEYQIAELLNRSIKEKTMAWSVDSKNELNGICIGKIVKPDKLYIITIVLKSKELFKIFLNKFEELYPTLRIVGYRRGKIKDFTKKISLLRYSQKFN